MRNLFLVLMLSIASTAFASTPMFYWDNQNKLVPAKACGLIKVESNRFRISNYSGKKTNVTENLRNINGKRQSHLVNASLVKLIEGKRKKNYKKVEITGINKLKGVRPNRWFSERGDQGYLFHRSLLPVDDYILKLTSGTPNVPLGNIRKNLVGTMWHIAVEGSYYKMICGEFPSRREYILFRVYTPEKKDGPAALVGVYFDETSIFRSFEALTKARAYREIPTVLEPARIDDLLDMSGDEYIGDLTDAQGSSDTNQLEEEEQPTVIEIDGNGGIEEEKVIKGSFEDVICIGSSTLNVRDAELEKVLFSATVGEKVKVFQGFDGETSKETVIDGNTYKFVKVEFPEREEKDETTGWVAEQFVQAKSACKHINNNTFIRDHSIKITSIDDPACCEFPTVKKPTHAYTSGMRVFGAGRAQGKRKHAASDLYRAEDEPALSVAPGTVIQGKYYYYQGTYAIQVRHAGGFIAVYGEITGKSPKGVKQGASLRMGDRVGYIGKVNSNCCKPMLHFELYSGKGKGPLKVLGNKFRRRSDLMNPTDYLLKWENGKF